MTKYSEGLFASDVVTLPCFGAPVQIRYKADDARVAGTQASSLAAGFAAASGKPPIHLATQPLRNSLLNN
jgi:hypothetical protein